MAVFWNGIVSVFVFVNVASTLNLLGIPVPEAFPAPTMEGEPMGWGMTLFLWIFLTPFILVGLGILAALVGALMGRTVVRLRPGEGVVFSGIGSWGKRQRFDPGSIRTVLLEEATEAKPGKIRSGSGQEIVLKTAQGGEIRLGSDLPPARRMFVAATLARLLGTQP